jgi:hypothetical protein
MSMIKSKVGYFLSQQQGRLLISGIRQSELASLGSGFKTSLRVQFRCWSVAFNPQNTPCVPAVDATLRLGLEPD